MTFSFEADLASALQARKDASLYRRRLTVTTPCQADITVSEADQSYVQFCSNDYLGLANHPEVIQAFQTAADRYGVGSGASHLVSGHSGLHEALEQALAAFTGRPRALLFSTGFMANLGTIQALLQKGDAVFEDKLNHASLIDAGLHSGASFYRYLHNDTTSLEKRLNKAEAKRKLIVADGVFSMDGDCAPMSGLIDVAKRHDAALMIDDAHGFGVLNHGRGLSVHNTQELPIYMATLGKAIGSFGAFVAGSEALIESLIQFARPYIYTTALPPAVAAASLASLDIIEREPQRFDHLYALIALFKQQARDVGFELMPSDTAIQPLVIGDEARALQWSEALKARGFLVTAIRQPTVAAGQARLRITMTANHTEAQTSALVDALVQVRQQYPLETQS